MNKIQHSILSIIDNPSSVLWYPALTKQLTSDAWETICQQYGIQQSNYSTELMLHGRVVNSLTTNFYLTPEIQNETKTLRPMKICQMPEKIVEMYSYTGSKPYSFATLQNSTVLQCLQESLELLALIPTIYETISHLIACIHIIQPEDDNFDISYSLPNIPFSIFVSIPSRRMENDSLRVAEAILHEAMHLQLTLIENKVPIIVATEKTYFSPWKSENRHPRGVFHAIYVFCVIKQYLCFLINKDIPALSIQYLKDRCNIISDQLMEVNGFINFPCFSDFGKSFINRLLLSDIETSELVLEGLDINNLVKQ